MLDKIKAEIFTRLEILFAEAAAHELTNDMENYQKSLEKVATIAETLGINTVITKVDIDINNFEIEEG